VLSQMQIRRVAEGYDQCWASYERDGLPAFVFNLMEPQRSKVDRAVLAFLKSEALHPADFTIREDGVVRLNPELARRVTLWLEDRRHALTLSCPVIPSPVDIFST
jgi:CRISPR-associated protein Cas1